MHHHDHPSSPATPDAVKSERRGGGVVLAGGEKKAALSPREKEVLGLLAEGCRYQEIAGNLGIGFETVRTHLQHIYQKLEVRTRTEAVVWFLRGKSGRRSAR